jgi:predicted nicotinamide N-methyase
MSNFDNTIGQNGKNNTQTNNITNNYNPTNNGSFSSLLGSDIVFDHNALKEIIILVHKKIFCFFFLIAKYQLQWLQ